MRSTQRAYAKFGAGDIVHRCLEMARSQMAGRAKDFGGIRTSDALAERAVGRYSRSIPCHGKAEAMSIPFAQGHHRGECGLKWHPHWPESVDGSGPTGLGATVVPDENCAMAKSSADGNGANDGVF